MNAYLRRRDETPWDDYTGSDSRSPDSGQEEPGLAPEGPEFEASHPK